LNVGRITFEKADLRHLNTWDLMALKMLADSIDSAAHKVSAKEFLNDHKDKLREVKNAKRIRC